MLPLFRDVNDHIRRIQEQIDSLHEVLAFAFEANLLVGLAQETRRLKEAGFMARDHRRADRDGRHLRHELHNTPELQRGYGFFRKAFSPHLKGRINIRIRRQKFSRPSLLIGPPGSFGTPDSRCATNWSTMLEKNSF
jgi:hypothetical protein